LSESSQPKPDQFSPQGIDHLVYACADLETGSDNIERLTGVRPATGGRHPGFGTHNALLSLGPGCYLEIIARDHTLPAPAQGALVDLPPGGNAGLRTWVYRTGNIAELAASSRAAGAGIGGVQSGSRETPDGHRLSWQLTDPYAMPMQGAVPFLIDWGSTTHPSRVAPAGGQLRGFRIEHPEPGKVRNALALLGAEVEVAAADAFRLVASIMRQDGTLVTLQ
jgi:hypothetical protein